MASLAQLYEGGRGVSVDRDAALMLYRQASAAGHANAGPEVRRIEAELSGSQYAR
jgi:TPR repeat protein